MNFLVIRKYRDRCARSETFGLVLMRLSRLDSSWHRTRDDGNCTARRMRATALEVAEFASVVRRNYWQINGFWGPAVILMGLLVKARHRRLLNRGAGSAKTS